MIFLQRARRWSGIVLLLIISGCASTPQTLQLLDHPPKVRRSVNLDHVTFFPQQAYQCGPAALATILVSQGIHTHPDKLISSVYIPELKGSLQLEMIASARNHGLLTYKLSPHMHALITEINAGHPVLVFQNLAYNWWPQWHYAVAVGYDLDQQEIHLRSGTYKNYRMSMATFERTWQRAKHWAYVILKPGFIPASAIPRAYIDAAISLENAGFTAQALTAFQAAGQHWPQHTTVLMALANSEYSAGNLETAHEVLRQLIRHHPQHANAWNNLAFILAEQNCHSAALKAIHCARQLAPDNLNIQHSYDQLKQLSVTDIDSCTTAQCPKP